MIRAHIQPLWPEYEFHIHVRRYAIQDLPKEEEKLGLWLRERWVEKDHLLDELKENWTVNLLKQA
jgi:lysophosphatidic acid acyltransferase/lysophosphatidylinositol acyltransferase